MSYCYLPSGLNGIEVIAPTKKGKANGITGIIIPIGFFKVSEYEKELAKLIEEEKLNIYTAKYGGVWGGTYLNHVEFIDNYQTNVNRFGLYLTKEPMETERIRIGSHWFKRHTVKEVDDIKEWFKRNEAERGK